MKKKQNHSLIYLSHIFLFPLFIFGKISRLYDKYILKVTTKKKDDFSTVDYF